VDRGCVMVVTCACRLLWEAVGGYPNSDTPLRYEKRPIGPDFRAFGTSTSQGKRPEPWASLLC
jgi:hypothetical protein